VLSTPLTICLVVLGRHVERFEFLDVMFGDRPALSPPELFYQRMLAEDPAEAVDKAEEFLKERPLSIYYDDVALPGLKLAQNDILRGSLDRAQSQRIKAAVMEVVDDLADQDDRVLVKETTHDAEAAAAIEAVHDAAADLPVLSSERLAPAWQGETPVLCVAGRGYLDEAVALMLAQLLQKHGLRARVEGADAMASLNIFRLDTSGVVMVCLSYLDASSPAHMRYSIRRLRRRLPEAKIVLGCWLAHVDAAMLRETANADVVATTLRDAVKLCLDAARNAAASTDAKAPEANVDAA
jgi:hypothetical protein